MELQKNLISNWCHFHHKESASLLSFPPSFNAPSFTPTCPITNGLPVMRVTLPSLSVDLHPHTQCLSNPPCFFSPPFTLFPPVCLSIPPSLRLSLSQTDSSDSDLELSAVRHQPEGLDQLQAQTKFTRKELQSLYRGFKNVCVSVGCSECPILILTCWYSLLPLSRNVPVEWWMRRHSRPSILSSFPKEVRDFMNLSVYKLHSPLPMQMMFLNCSYSTFQSFI